MLPIHLKENILTVFDPSPCVKNKWRGHLGPLELYSVGGGLYKSVNTFRAGPGGLYDGSRMITRGGGAIFETKIYINSHFSG